MKMNHKIVVKLVAIFLLTSMIITFTHCVPKTAKEVGDGGGGYTKSTISTPATPKSEGQVINEIQVTTGIKNHEQILHTMGAVTGIDPFAVTAIMNVYNQISASLPTDNDIKVYTATQQVAVTKLAAEFCFQLSQSGFASQRNIIWPGFNIGAVSNTAFSFENRTLFIDQTIDGLWGGMVSNEERNMVHEELGNLIEVTIDGGNSTTLTARTFRAVCTAALSSAYVTLL
ncbi:MAG: hypothetical protein ACLGHN_06165 [Bacteriovoracia bacterium]